MKQSIFMAKVCGTINRVLFNISDTVGYYWVDVLEQYVFELNEHNAEVYNEQC